MTKQTQTLTVAQALVRFLTNQFTERDGIEERLISGCFGIFGHGNVAGVGEALLEAGDDLRYYQARNEQAMVHTAAGYARMKNRLSTLACTTSVGPGATNLVTGAAVATVNRIPVLLLPGDISASRIASPVLHQLEQPSSGDISVNDCLRPVSRYFDRVWRAEQLVYSAMQAMRVLTDPAETGTVTLALPQDVQTEAYPFPEEFLGKRVWRVRRPGPDRASLSDAVEILRSAKRPLIVSGGGTIYSEGTDALREFAEATGIPVAETQSGKGSLPSDHPCAVGPIGITGGAVANSLAQQADVVFGIGTRWTDFTTASHTLFAHPDVRFINLNIAAFDAAKHAGISLVADARRTLEVLLRVVEGWRVSSSYTDEVTRLAGEWRQVVEAALQSSDGLLPSQREVIGAVNDAVARRDVVVSSGGSIPADLHRLWRTSDPKGYQVSYGNSSAGYEIAGGIGVKLASPEREVFVLIGDGSYLLMPSEIVTAVQENLKLIVLIVQNHGFASVAALSESIGSYRFGTSHRYRNPDSQQLDGDLLPIDLATNAGSLGAHVIRAVTIDDLRRALTEAVDAQGTTVIHIETDPVVSALNSKAWWDVPIAEVSEIDATKQARARYEENKKAQRPYL